MKIGVLIIGSLYWDRLDHRTKWRATRLMCGDAQHVRVPIRYGRRSSSRGCSYTMVFSTGLSKNQFGCGIVVPCQSQDLVKEAKYLWAAEMREGGKPNDRISANWGCIALRINPERPIPEELRDNWTECVSKERCYGRLMNSSVGEEVAVDESGFLKIPWPKLEDGANVKFDALLATMTNPTIVNGRYATAQQIANAWNTSSGEKYRNYFFNNRKWGIKTFQDAEIEGLL